MRIGVGLSIPELATRGARGEPAPPPTAEYLLLESSDFILLEDGTSKIELE